MTFTQNIWLLIITAALTGVLVPFIKTTVDYFKLRQQKIFEADQLRQSQRIQSQISALGDFIRTSVYESVFDARSFLLPSLPDCRTNTMERQLLAMQKYDRESWETFAKIGIEIGKAQPLVSAATYQRLKDFYRNWLVMTDNRYSALAADETTTTDAWKEYHVELFTKGASKIDKVLGSLARELKLAAPRYNVASAALQAAHQ